MRAEMHNDDDLENQPMRGRFPFSQVELSGMTGSEMVATSLVQFEDSVLWLNKGSQSNQLAVLGIEGNGLIEVFQGEAQGFGRGCILKLCPLNHANALALRAALEWLRPRPLGLSTSAGFGDRLGLATPGHVRALRQAQNEAPGRSVAPIFAQQSIREMERTNRDPSTVLDDATWGAFEAGWRGPLGADADHLKTLEDVDACSAAGYTLYTIDPSNFMHDFTRKPSERGLLRQMRDFPFAQIETSEADLLRRYAGQIHELESHSLAMSSRDVGAAVVKYGKVIMHVSEMARHVASKGIPYELEISVDEAGTPTTPVEHYFLVSELIRLGVHLVGFAPRFVGRFEKGVDFLGDIAALRQDLDRHAEIARVLGPYKLSLHSGSDKFTVYQHMYEATKGLMHLKTAGTSYLEALRIVARVSPSLFRELAFLANERYPHDRASYYVSASPSTLQGIAELSDAQLPEIMDQSGPRQVLHVTFGSVLARFGTELLSLLRIHEEEYVADLTIHFLRHLRPMLASSRDTY